MTKDEHLFLERLACGSSLPPVTSRGEDRARQSCKRQGWATFDRPAWLWRITDKGRNVLATLKP